MCPRWMNSEPLGMAQGAVCILGHSPSDFHPRASSKQLHRSSLPAVKSLTTAGTPHLVSIFLQSVPKISKVLIQFAKVPVICTINMDLFCLWQQAYYLYLYTHLCGQCI